MCKVSDKLQLCTCNESEDLYFDDHWTLQRPGNEDVTLVGEFIMPADIGEALHQINHTAIRKMLNAGTCFDIKPDLRDGDILQLYFTLDNENAKKYVQYPPAGNFLVYAFRLKAGRWVKAAFEPWIEIARELQRGQIVNGLEN